MTSLQYIETFNTLLSMDHMTCEQIRPQIESLVLASPISMHEIKDKFVVRTSVLEPGEVCTNLSRCTYNPNQSTIKLQRCNYEKQQVFYASMPGGMTNLSDGAQSSFLETCFDRIKEDPDFSERFIVCTRWVLKKAPVVWVLPSYPGSVELNENFKFLSENFDTILKQRAIDEGQFLDLKSKAAFLSSLYCCADNKQSVYRLTATFHNEFCRIFSKQASRKIDGLLYPSANTKGEGMNVVFDKDYIQDENVICDHAVLYHYLRDPNNNKSISFLPIAACNPQLNGNLSFIPLTDDDLR